MTKAPCTTCKVRYPACHDSCEIYNKWHKDLRATKEHNMKERDLSLCANLKFVKNRGER